MTRSRLLLAAALAGLSLSACRHEDPKPGPSSETAKEAVADSSQGTAGDSLPDVLVRGWSIFQQPTGDQEVTEVQVWAPGDHQKQVFTAMVTDLYRQHAHFADWADGSLFVVTRHGTVESGAWNDGLWEYRDGKEPRRLASGKGIDFRTSPDGKRLVVTLADSTGAGDWLRIQDRSGKVLKEKDLVALGWESIDALWMGDSVLYAEVSGELHRWDLRTDSLVPVTLPKGASLWDYAILPDRDLLVSSDVQRDADDAKGKPVVLTAFGLRSGKGVAVEHAVGHTFRPRFQEKDSLEYDSPAGKGEVRKATPRP